MVLNVHRCARGSGVATERQGIKILDFVCSHLVDLVEEQHVCWRGSRCCRTTKERGSF